MTSQVSGPGSLLGLSPGLKWRRTIDWAAFWLVNLSPSPRKQCFNVAKTPWTFRVLLWVFLLGGFTLLGNYAQPVLSFNDFLCFKSVSTVAFVASSISKWFFFVDVGWFESWGWGWVLHFQQTKTVHFYIASKQKKLLSKFTCFYVSHMKPGALNMALDHCTNSTFFQWAGDLLIIHLTSLESGNREYATISEHAFQRFRWAHQFSDSTIGSRISSLKYDLWLLPHNHLEFHLRYSLQLQSLFKESQSLRPSNLKCRPPWISPRMWRQSSMGHPFWHSGLNCYQRYWNDALSRSIGLEDKSR